MASPNTLALRREMAQLQPRPVRLDVEPTRKTMLPGEFAGQLRASRRDANARDARTRAARPRKPGAIPTSGQARVNAKRSLRLLDAQPHRPCAEPAGDGPGCAGHAIPGSDRCRRHAPADAWAAFLAARPVSA